MTLTKVSNEMLESGGGAGGGGETNTGTNVNTDGVGVFDGKSGTTLNFRGIASGTTALTVTLDPVDNDIDLQIANAVSGGAAGLLLGTDKAKLDGITAGAEPNTVDTVFGLTGNVDIDTLTQESTPADGDWLVLEKAASPGTFRRVRVVDVGGGGASSPPFNDDMSLVQDATDTTKELRLEVGAVTTGTQRVWTAPDQDVDFTPNSGTYPAASHAARHTDGTDDIQDATTGQKGLMTAAQATKLDGIEALADVTDSAAVDAAGAIVHGDISPSAGYLIKTASETYTAIQHKHDATAAPGASNDNTEGYAIGSQWIDVTNDNEYVCVDASTGAAVWQARGGGSGGAPTGASYITLGLNASLTGERVFTPGVGLSFTDNGANSTYDLSVDIAPFVGTAVDDIVQLEDVGGGTAGLPAVDGSQLTNLGAAQPADITFENLDANGDIGTGSSQVAAGDHDHPFADLGTVTLTAIELTQNGFGDPVAQSGALQLALSGATHVSGKQVSLLLTGDGSDITVDGTTVKWVPPLSGAQTFTDERTLVVIYDGNAGHAWATYSSSGGTGGGAVDSVNGETGTVVLDATEIDISALSPSDYTPASADIEGHLSGIDTALGEKLGAAEQATDADTVDGQHAAAFATAAQGALADSALQPAFLPTVATHTHSASGAVAPSLTGPVRVLNVTMDANGTSWAPTNVPTTTDLLYEVRVRFTQGAGGSATLDLSGVSWQGGAPSLGSTAGDWLEVIFAYFDGGSARGRFVDQEVA